jgi:NADH-quinone oxidoreductase subunit M
VCALSLVGFPGTIGFVSEELLFQGGFAYRLQILPIIVGALALNGYSCFRLFARSFFGNPSFPDAAALPLATRERASLLIITAFILANGLLPDLMLKVFFWWI